MRALDVSTPPSAAGAGPAGARAASQPSARVEDDFDGLGRTIHDFFEPRAAAVDVGRASVRDGLAFLGGLGLAEADLARSEAIVAAVARSDLATAFSAWAHRMVIQYLGSARLGSPLRERLADLAAARTLGVTALAAGTAHVLAGAPLPVTYRADGQGIVLDGRIPWASNLHPPYLIVTAAADADRPDRAAVVAIPDTAPGVEPAPFPDLLALGATGSTTVKLTGVRVPDTSVISDDLRSFATAVLPRFLLLQSAFCRGLAERALEQARANLGPLGDGLGPRLEEATEAFAATLRRSRDRAVDVDAGRPVAIREVLDLRLRWSELAATAVHLELAAVGGRGYLAASDTARRVREVAFLPVQAPTEVLLRWLLSRSA